MKSGNFVRFSNPQPGEENLVFQVVEMRHPDNTQDTAPARVLVKSTDPTFEIAPTFQYLASDLVRVFKDFTDISIPSFLDAPAWIDESWSNDAAPHVRFDLPSDSPYTLCVWVNNDNKELRECWENFKFCVIVYEKDTWDEIDGLEVDSKAECIDAIEHFRESIMIVINNGRANA